MPRNIQSGGGKEHIELVKLAVKRVVDEFSEKVRGIHICFEKAELKMEIEIKRDQWGYTHTNFTFRPDIIVDVMKDDDKLLSINEKEWKSIFDSDTVLFEAETDPRNLFSNNIKIEAYRRIRADGYGRNAYAFVLVCWSDAKLPRNKEPFDEIWRFPR